MAKSVQISENPVIFGKERSLIGFVTRPNGPNIPASHLAVVILNTGVIHRVGHHRMYVTFSRAIADAGLPVLRFDFSGVGDSERRIDGLPPLEANLADIKEALDWFEVSVHVKRFVIIGMCAGSDHAVIYAANDPRVVGLVLMEPAIPPTRRFIREYLADRLLNMRSWMSVVFGSSYIRRLLFERVLSVVVPGWEPRGSTLTHPKIRAELEQIYGKAAARGVKFLVFLAESGRYATYGEQLRDAFPNAAFDGNLQSELFYDCDHIFTSEANRRKLLKLLLPWLRNADFRNALVANGSLPVSIAVNTVQ